MKNQIISYILAVVFVFAAAFTSCKKDEKPKTVTVAAQAGTMTAGTAETVTFAVTTENIANGSYDAAMANLPTGVNVQGKVTITAGSGTLTLAGSAGTQAGTTDNLTLTIDGATSKPFALTVTTATYTISALPATLQFGSLQSPYTQPAAQAVVITNTGTGTVTLNALPTIDNYTLGALSATTLAAGAQATFTVQPNAGLAAGIHYADITVTGSNGASAKVNASFEVTAATYMISATPATLQFGSLQTPYTQPAAQTVTITNTVTETVTLNALPTVENYTLGALSTNTLAAGAQATFTVQPNAGLAAGTYNPTITVTGLGGASATVSVSFEVTTAGSNTYAISASPTTLQFGTLPNPYTQPAAQTVTITNTGTETVTLNALPAVASYTLGALSTTTLAAGATATFTVRPNAGLAVGTYNREITITDSNGASATVNAKFEVTSAALTYKISVSPDRLFFGTLQRPYTQPDAETVTITNRGTGTVTLNALPSLTSFTLSPLSATTLAAGEQAIFTVQPRADMDVGDKYNSFTISGTNGVSTTVYVNFMVTAASDEPGSPEKPIKVANYADLLTVGRGTGSVLCYEQTANITIPAGTNWEPPQSDFYGTYDGGGFSISNLRCHLSESWNHLIGLFYSIGSGGVVKNLALINVSINGVRLAGGVAGENFGTIQNCYVTGSISNDAVTWLTGGIVGGVAGVNHGTIENCYATGNVVSECSFGGNCDYSLAGGVVAASEKTINCVALNKAVRSGGTVGRVVGSDVSGWDELTFTNNYARATGMTLTVKNVAVSVTPDVGGKHGANVSQADYNGANSGTWWSATAKFSSAYWDMANNRLPHLKTTTGKAFSQVQNPVVTP